MNTPSAHTRSDRLLEKHGLKKTPLRRLMLDVLSSASVPLSQADLIESLLSRVKNVDRVSVYRNLGQLKAAGLVHEVDTNSYIGCQHECEKHPHVLLYCQRCHKHREIKDHDGIRSMMEALGRMRFFGKSEPLFLKGTCSACT
ncbi:MAG: transcriptional repressor [Bdellovibrionaceae bacterium]|nr:transcriptional repressor [Pseudobdellovibrionaceae bacterium]